MWSPANKLALPSAEEKKCAYKAIEQLEEERKAAMEVLERAQAHVDALTKELDERKAWVAPIRKLPPEVLSEIFALVSEVDWLGPVVLSEISRLWRHVVLGTSRAWSRIYLTEHLTPYAAEYVEMFLPRSNPAPLHLYFPESFTVDAEEPTKEAIYAGIQRFQCLNLPRNRLDLLEDGCYPNLTRMTLGYSASGISPSFFNCSRFPRLRFLDCMECDWRLPADDAGTVYQLPPLQHLSITFENHLAWIEAVRSCSMTLETLELRGNFSYEGTQVFTISFPLLESLYLESWDDEVDLSWPVQATTPALVSYEECDEAERPTRPPLHEDVRKVTHLRTMFIPNLPTYPALRLLQLKLGLLQVTLLIEQLNRDTALCSELQAIEVIPPTREEDLEVSLCNALKQLRPQVDLYFADVWSFSMVNCFDSKRCGQDMPCLAL